MKKIVYSLVVVSALFLNGCGDDDKNENNETQALATSGVADRNGTDAANETSKEGQSYTFTVLRVNTDDEEKTGKVSYAVATQRCQATKPDGHPEGGFSLPTLAELESIDTVQLKTNAAFDFRKVMATESDAILLWTEDKKSFILYDNDNKDKEYTGQFEDTKPMYYICIKPNN